MERWVGRGVLAACVIREGVDIAARLKDWQSSEISSSVSRILTPEVETGWMPFSGFRNRHGCSVIQ